MKRSLVGVAVALALPGTAAAAPAPSLTSSELVGPAPLVVRFDATGTLGASSYTWRFGDGTTATGATPAHRFVKPGRYTVTLTVANDAGEAATTSLVVRAQTLTLRPVTTVFGKPAAVWGTVLPPEAARIVVERRAGASWKFVKAAASDSRGRFSVRVRPGRSGVWRARLAGTQVRAAARLTVIPRLRLVVGPGTAFVGARLLVRSQPPRPGRARVTVLRSGRTLAERTVPVGQPATIPAPGIGRFAVRVEFGGATARAAVEAAARTLSVGSAGPDVLAFSRRLAELRIHVPGPSTTFGHELFDAVLAFQKSRGLARTGTVTDDVWRALTSDRLPRPRYRTGAPHIEVDKGRQILLVVEQGETVAVLPVSSGAGGITPAGSFRILWKAPATSTWLGPAILYRTMTFNGNVAIHGFPSVPAYPASHGCVRIPIWAADWLYTRSPVGERVYVYE